LKIKSFTGDTFNILGHSVYSRCQKFCPQHPMLGPIIFITKLQGTKYLTPTVSLTKQGQHLRYKLYICTTTK